MAKEFCSGIGAAVIFHGLKEAELRSWRASRCTRATRTIICREGDPGSLLSDPKGRVTVEKRGSDAAGFEITELAAGYSFGRCACRHPAPSATIRTQEETFLASFPYAAFLRLSQQNLSLFATVLLNIAREFSRRLRKMDNRLVEYLQRPTG